MTKNFGGQSAGKRYKNENPHYKVIYNVFRSRETSVSAYN